MSLVQIQYLRKLILAAHRLPLRITDIARTHWLPVMICYWAGNSFGGRGHDTSVRL